ncbi:MAG: hypothetical protein ACP5N3_04665 [Candidatus Nanoarchaeia archaeon]
MFKELKEGQQYSFSLELSSRDINEQHIEEIATFFDSSRHNEKETERMQNKENVDVPLSIFHEGESSLKAIVHYLKDEKKLSFSRIAILLGRDQRTIWSTYNQPFKTAKKAKKTSKTQTSPTIFINTELFKERKLSVLETIAAELLKKNSVKKVSELLGKNQMTIWTVKRRAEKKLRRKIITIIEGGETNA